MTADDFEPEASDTTVRAEPPARRRAGAAPRIAPEGSAAGDDPEVAAMQAVAGAMSRVEALDEGPRQRVLAWMVSRWGPFPGAQAAAAAPRRGARREAPQASTPYEEGEELEVSLAAPGRKDRQAAGYLEDGTLVVVDDADHLLGTTVRIVVERVRPTSRGHMLFARLAGIGNGRRDAPSF